MGCGISFHSEYFISLQPWGWSGLRKPPPRLQARCQPGSVHQLGVRGRWELFHPMAAPSKPPALHRASKVQQHGARCRRTPCLPCILKAALQQQVQHTPFLPTQGEAVPCRDTSGPLAPLCGAPSHLLRAACLKGPFLAKCSRSTAAPPGF